jgi:hypothetical protein
MTMLVALLALAALQHVGGAAAAPAWAQGVQAWGIIDLPSAGGTRDLEKLKMRPGTLVAQDRRDHIFLLDAETGSVQEFAPGGDLIDSWTAKSWKPLPAIPGLSSFAVDRRGGLFAFVSQGTVRLFNRERRIAETRLQTLATGLAFAHGELVVARLPMEPGKVDRRQLTEVAKPVLITRVDLEGKVLGEALAPDPVEGPDVFSAALTAALDVASDAAADEPSVWAADRYRLYRLRRLTSAGEADRTWRADSVMAPVSFSGEAPAGVAKDIPARPVDLARPVATPAPPKFNAFNAVIVVRTLVVRDGLVFVLLDPGAVADMPVIDVVTDPSQGPAWRFALRSDKVTYYRQLAVTEGGFWLFPVASGVHPRWIERPTDAALVQPPTAPTAPY